MIEEMLKSVVGAKVQVCFRDQGLTVVVDGILFHDQNGFMVMGQYPRPAVVRFQAGRVAYR